MISAFDQIISSAGHELHRHAEHFFVDRVREPLVVDFGDAVAGAEDHVDELVAVMRLGQPVAERDLGLEARRASARRACAARRAAARRCRSPSSSAKCPRSTWNAIAAADHVRHAAAVQHLERRAIQLRFLGRGHERRSCVSVTGSPFSCRNHAVFTTGRLERHRWAAVCRAAQRLRRRGRFTIRYGGRSGLMRVSSGMATL